MNVYIQFLKNETIVIVLMNKVKLGLGLGLSFVSFPLLYIGLNRNKNVLNNEIVEFIDKMESIR